MRSMEVATSEPFPHALKQRLKSDTFAWLAFGAFLSWMFGLYWSNFFTAQVATTSLDFLQLRSLWLAVEALTLVAFFVALGFKVRQTSLIPTIAGGLTCLSTGILLFMPAELGETWVLIAVAGTGIGSSLLLVSSGIQFSAAGPQRLLMNVALALFVASLFDATLLLMPFDAQRVIVSLLPVMYVALFILSLKRTPLSYKAGEASKPLARTKGSRRLLLLRAILLPLIVGLAYGLMQRLATEGQVVSTGAGTDFTTILSILLSSVIIMVGAFFFDRTSITKLLCFVAVPIICTAFVLLPLFSNMQEAAQAVCIVGFNSFYFMVWALWSGDQEGLSLSKRFTLGLFVLVGSESLGSVLGMALLEVAPKSGQTLAITSLVVVYLLLMAALFSFGRALESKSTQNSHGNGNNGENAFDSGITSGVGEDSSSAPMSAAQGFTEASLQVWANRYKLSARETEVFDLLAKGRNRSYISKTLVVSDNTTRTHMRNIYRKLEIHSQQELIDLIEQEYKDNNQGLQ